MIQNHIQQAPDPLSHSEEFIRSHFASDKETLLPSSHLSPQHEIIERPVINGKNFSCCWGRIMWGPNLCAGWAMFIIIALFGLGSSAILFPHLSMSGRFWSFISFFGLTAYFLWKTETSDPGIFPKASQLPEGHPLLQPPADSVNPPNNNPPQPMMRKTVGLRFCQVCGIYRPKGCKHCYECDNCVMEFDHHCPFVNNCIGMRNQGYFSFFLLWCGVSLIGYCVIAVFVFVKKAKTDKEWFTHSISFPLIIFMMMMDFLVSLPVLWFAGYQIFLVLTDQTTVQRIYNDIRGSRRWYQSFYDRIIRIPPPFMNRLIYTHNSCWFRRTNKLFTKYLENSSPIC
ncbi:putative Palmitoyltransferase app [Blattamonas nauphoetae]|uniref:Palmitoyltransferase n=1 Tax=Blattamonas nauphoetae TaxID=2049346 RepID=A0ABQ9XKY1_9EUKA|nr:putative Palmitoyltransferase app [Blattamonas nauphoetae]